MVLGAFSPKKLGLFHARYMEQFHEFHFLLNHKLIKIMNITHFLHRRLCVHTKVKAYMTTGRMRCVLSYIFCTKWEFKYSRRCRSVQSLILLLWCVIPFQKCLSCSTRCVLLQWERNNSDWEVFMTPTTVRQVAPFVRRIIPLILLKASIEILYYFYFFITYDNNIYFKCLLNCVV